MSVCEENFVAKNYISNNNSDNNKNYINCVIITKIKFNNKLKFNKKQKLEKLEKLEKQKLEKQKSINFITNEGKYFGDIKNFQKNGFGIMEYPSDSEYKFYAGMWKNNNIQGDGDMVFRDGRIYSGMWKNNKLNGIGKLFYGNLEYVGIFKNNLLSGYGYIIKNENIEYGIWKDNFFYINNLDSFLSQIYFIFN